MIMHIPNKIKKSIKLVKPAFCKNAFDKFFSWKDLENLLNLRPFVNANRCKIIDFGEERFHVWKQQTWVSDISSFPPSILESEIKKSHCYLSDASRANKKINAICNELENTFIGGAADAHIYFNVSNNLNGGFGIHWDFSHNLIIQMEGETQFKVWDNTVFEDNKSKSPKSLKEKPIIDVVMKTGDALFIPLRVYHQALSKSKRMSISFPISFNNSTEKQERNWIKVP